MPGVCPRARNSDYDKKTECTSDATCPDNQKCCAEGYGRVCKPPIQPGKFVVMH
ncbi:hypothetical protein DPMN_077772 [Dreissena polymorpha]|uniref:WAP domain-containing protein n=1 Tax=Dreissena polymorpha TaxID=45954 RepID=A0A9D3YQM1_DREPO|nr:hypothetical protein DPMN_077772 [Dreissena polymorpha]